LISLRQPPRGTGEVADLPWIHHGNWQVPRSKSRSERSFVAAGRLEHDQGGRKPGETREEPGHSTLAVGKGEDLARWKNVDAEPVLGDIDADEDRCCGGMFHGPSLRIRARRAAAAQATVRDLGNGSGRSAMLRYGLALLKPFWRLGAGKGI
jgi:hypothetical protein